MGGERVIRGELIYVIPDLIAERKRRIFSATRDAVRPLYPRP